MAVKKDTTTKKKVSKGDLYECGVCGMAVVVDEPCGCEDDFALMCCGEPMKERKTPAKTAK
jgi:hypothetical protein